jgi:hypothetical protein
LLFNEWVDAGIVGSVVLPILGAVPDGMLILFSGIGDDAQNQLAVSEPYSHNHNVIIIYIQIYLLEV